MVASEDHQRPRPMMPTMAMPSMMPMPSMPMPMPMMCGTQSSFRNPEWISAFFLTVVLHFCIGIQNPSSSRHSQQLRFQDFLNSAHPRPMMSPGMPLMPPMMGRDSWVLELWNARRGMSVTSPAVASHFVAARIASLWANQYPNLSRFVENVFGEGQHSTASNVYNFLLQQLHKNIRMLFTKVFRMFALRRNIHNSTIHQGLPLPAPRRPWGIRDLTCGKKMQKVRIVYQAHCKHWVLIWQWKISGRVSKKSLIRICKEYYLQLRNYCGPRVSWFEDLKASQIAVSSPWFQALQIYFE